jgi:hypothetical protein
MAACIEQKAIEQALSEYPQISVIKILGFAINKNLIVSA